MQMNPAVGERVLVRPSGETGRVTRVVEVSDGRLTYEVEFDTPTSGGRSGTGETGGLYVPEEIEPVS